MLDVERIPRRRWALIGAVAGLLLALGGMVGPEPNRRTLGQADFEQEIVGFAFPGQPLLTDLVVRPANQGHRVTGQRLTRKADGWYAAPFTMHAPSPYVPLHLATGEPAPANVMAYMDQLGPSHRVSYTYAWFADTPLRLAVYTVAGALVVGGAWPLALSLLVGAGLGRVPPSRVVDQEALVPDGTTDQPPPQPAVPAELPQPAEHAEHKHYAGIYYPTEAHVPTEQHGPPKDGIA
jgi:hypothetical protein